MSGEHDTYPHRVTCARRMRERALQQAGSPQPVPTTLLDTIAAEIHGHCGHHLLKCRRLAWGWSVAQAVTALHTMAERMGARTGQLTERSWKDWEAGTAPLAENQDLLCRLFATGPVQLGFARDYSASTPGAMPQQGVPWAATLHRAVESAGTIDGATATTEGAATNRRTAFTALGLLATAPVAALSSRPSADDALALTAALERTDLGRGTLDHLHQRLRGFASDYATKSANDSWPEVWRLRRQAAILRAGRHTLTQERELIRIGGMLSIVLAWLSHDLGETKTALAFALDALHHGRMAESDLVCAWADDVAATVHLYNGRADSAARCASRGLAAAPNGTTAHVRLAAQSARAHARVGHYDRFVEDHRLAQQLAQALPAHASGLFSADQVRLTSFDASSYLSLNQPRKALAAAEQAVAQYRTDPSLSPTRAVLAHLDLAVAHATLGKYDAALDAGAQALSTPRPADAITTRTRDLAKALNSTTAPVVAREFACHLLNR